MAFVLGVGVDLAVPVGARRIAGQAAPALAVLDDDDFAVETVGVLEDALDEAPDEVGVRAAAVLPLGVDLDQDDVSGGDEAVRPVLGAGDGGAVELEPLAAHEIDEGIDPGVPVPRREGVVGDPGDPEDGIPGVSGVDGVYPSSDSP